MEIIASIFTIIISTLSIGGIFVNNSLTKILEKNSEEIGQVDIRIKNVPTHQLIEGKSDGIQVNLQQWQIKEDIRVELLQIETDAIALNIPKLQELRKEKARGKDWLKTLKEPLNMGWRVVITEEDLNNILLSEQVQSMINKFSTDNSQVDVIELSFDLQPENRLVVDSKVKLAFRGEEELNIRLEVDLELIKGHEFKISQLKGTLNGRQLSSQLLQGFADNINNRLSLRLLEELGITLRLLQFEIDEDNIAIAGFVHVQPQSP